MAAVLRDAWQGRMKPTQAELLADVVLKHNIKVVFLCHELRGHKLPWRTTRVGMGYRSKSMCSQYAGAHHPWH